MRRNLRPGPIIERHPLNPEKTLDVRLRAPLAERKASDSHLVSKLLVQSEVPPQHQTNPAACDEITNAVLLLLTLVSSLYAVLCLTCREWSSINGSHFRSGKLFNQSRPRLCPLRIAP